MNIEIQDVLVITMYSGPRWEVAQNIRYSCCHFLNSSRPFNLWRSLNGQDHRGVILIEETSPDIANITRTSGIELMNVISSEGY